MPLRSPNNPGTDVTILGVVRQVIVPNTALAANSQDGTGGLSQVYIQQLAPLALSTAVFPAVVLFSGKQSYALSSANEYIGQLEVIINYYDRWDRQSQKTLDTIWANTAADLERMKANLETNESLTYMGETYAVSTPKFTLSPYQGTQENRFPGLTLIVRTLTASVNILPYDALT